MLFVKTLIGLIPSSIRLTLKKNAKLADFYSRILQRSGLFYGFPSPKKLQAHYAKLVNKQTQEINEIVRLVDQGKSFDVFLIVTESTTSTLATIISLASNQSIREIFLVGDSQPISLVLDSLQEGNYAEQVKVLNSYNFETKEVVLLLRSGDYIHQNLMHIYLDKLSADLADNTMIYCDCDYLDKDGIRHKAELLPDWNPDLQLSSGYIKTAVGLSGKEIISDFIRFSHKQQPENLIPKWVASVYLNKIDVVIEHIAFTLLHQSLGPQVDWNLGISDINRDDGFSILKQSYVGVVSLQWNVSTNPLVSLIIPTKNAWELVEKCIDSILTKTTYKHFEILLIDNNSDELASLKYFEELNNHPQIKVLKYPYGFNYSAINNFAVEHANGEVIALVNNDVEVISADWLLYMLGHVLREDVGCVGAKLLYPDGRIQHAGVVMGYGGGAGHAHKYFPRYHPGYMNRLVATQNYSAVTAACLLVMKQDYLDVAGLDECNLKVAFNDVDFCLNVLQLGRRNVYCAEAELFHHESVSRGHDHSEEKRMRFEKELHFIQSRWATYIDKDPAYNVNLTLRRENFSIRE
ncbi:MAG: GT2 family glycosyltransferase [Paraglaciecola sp.]|jgi:GT2 family glycosyltransferase